MLKCPICNKELKLLNNSHLRQHNLTIEDFKKQYPNFNTVSEELIQNCKKNNPERARQAWKKYKDTHTQEEIDDRIHKQTKKNLKRNMSIANSMKKMKGKNTIIEITVKNQLDQYLINYKQQKTIKNENIDVIAVADFYLPDYNLVIECNGDFWHCNPEKYLNGPEYNCQRYKVERDKIKRQIYELNNLNVLVIWENEIKGIEFNILTYLQQYNIV